MSELRLSAELVPSTSWCDNVRSRLSRSEWDKVRKKVYADHNHLCGICGAKSKLAAHETWHYNDHSHVQTLTGMIALCTMCHHVKHIGLAELLHNEGKLDYARVVAHFCKVNGCSVDDFLQHRQQAFDQWAERSQNVWEVNIDALQAYLK